MIQNRLPLALRSDFIAIVTFRIGALAAIVISIGFIMVGLWELGYSFWSYAVSHGHSDAHNSQLTEVLMSGIHAIELFSLAPLP